MKKIRQKLKTKSEIVVEIAKKKHISFSISDLFVSTVLAQISQALLKGYKVELRGFGTFGVKKHKAYKGRNPQNQKEVMIQSKKRPWFKPGLFKNTLNSRP